MSFKVSINLKKLTRSEFVSNKKFRQEKTHHRHQETHVLFPEQFYLVEPKI